RRLRDADGTCCRLNSGGLERLHQLLEPEALGPAEQILRLHLEAVEGNLVFLHAAIAEHLDLGPAHAFRWEWILVVAAGLFGKQHRQPAMAALLGIGT